MTIAMIGTKQTAETNEPKKRKLTAKKIQSGISRILNSKPLGNIASSDTNEVVMQAPMARGRTPGPSDGVCGASS